MARTKNVTTPTDGLFTQNKAEANKNEQAIILRVYVASEKDPKVETTTGAD